MRWPFRKTVTESVPPTSDEVTAASRTLTIHRDQAHRDRVMANVRAIRSEPGLGEWRGFGSAR